MLRTIIFFTIVFLGSQLYGQSAISGYVPQEDGSITSQEIHLSQIDLENLSDYSKAKNVDKAAISENGFFRFEKNSISDTDAIYRLHFTQIGNTEDDSLVVHHLFMLSNRDSIHFKKTVVPFSNYTTTNLGDKEWQRLRQFEHRIREGHVTKEDSLSEAYVVSMKTYAKDSLQILMVKLIGIKQLDNKRLLEKDIAKNPEYYVALLKELKESDLERADYLFLENKLAFLTTEVAERKYVTSTIINLLLGFGVVALLFLLFRSRRTNTTVVDLSDLSRQERNVQGLILEGKSNKEIANELFISLSTVKTHITNIYGKLQVSSRQELLRKIQNS